MEKLKKVVPSQRFLETSSIAILLFLPWLDRGLATSLPLIFVWATLALSYNIILGLAGIPSFGHAIPFGVGAFTTALMLKTGMPYFLTVVLAGILAGLTYVAMGLPAYRVRGLYYGILTLAIAEAVRSAIESYARTTVAITIGTIPEMVDITGLILYLALYTLFLALTLLTGIANVKATRRKNLKIAKTIFLTALLCLLAIGTFKAYKESLDFLTQVGQGLAYVKVVRFLYPVNLYLVTLLTLYISYLLIKRITMSPLGSVWVAVRENPLRASVLGYNVFAHQLAAFLASGFFAGISGGIYVAVIPTVMPDVFATDKTFIALTGVIIGGLGTILGPVIGGMITGFLRDYLSGLSPLLIGFGWISLQQAQLLPSFALGIIYIIVVLALPYGIWGTWLLKGWKVKRKMEKLLGFETS